VNEQIESFNATLCQGATKRSLIGILDMRESHCAAKRMCSSLVGRGRQRYWRRSVKNCKWKIREHL